MGVYNPHAPYVVGEEWVDIRDEDITFSPSINALEQGHTFTPTANRVLTTGRFYVKTPPPAQTQGQVMQMAVYKTGTEAISGPVQQVLIPCNAGAVTGLVTVDGINSATSAQVVTALATAGDGYSLVMQPGDDANAKRLMLYFAVSQYAQLLAGKRILKVELIHGLSYDPTLSGTLITVPNPIYDSIPQTLAINTSGVPFSSSHDVTFAPFVIYYGSSLLSLNPPIGLPSQANPPVVTNFGEINPLWLGGTSALSTSEYLPWRYEELARFEISAGVNRTAVRYEFGAVSGGDGSAATYAGTWYLNYAALRVTFCEENRVAYGSSVFNAGSFGAVLTDGYHIGQNVLTMRDTSFNTLPVLQSGQQYTAVMDMPDMGDAIGPFTNTETLPVNSETFPVLNGLRGLTDSPVHVGVKVILTTTPGEAFEKETTTVLPQLSLHTSGGPLTEMHVYGRQAIGQVYGGITVTQEILDSAAGGSASWPQVRYYARRFGATTVSLTLTIATQSVTITPTEFDALDEILDGWKEVTLRFTTAPTFGTGTNPQAVWGATGELAGNRWEILGATAPALSGIPGNLLNLSPVALSTATYGQPSAGSTINMGWIPQYAPPVSATTDDQTSDAVLMFSQDPLAVTGFTVSQASQTLTGVGLDCNVYPWYVPTGMAYNQLTWSATNSSVPTSGFGYYELQRSDTATDWQTIAHLTSPAATGFRDYEARVGVLTSYRIRGVNELLFAGLWSSTVTITTAAPPVTGSGIGSTSRILMFTTNEVQNGNSNLAYAKAQDSGTSTEAFNFPEAGFTQFQLMYNRDYQVAFRPHERGGSVWTVPVLVQAASISPPNLPNFTSLRDLAWADLPYVCVKDEAGNRWFANVGVPSGNSNMNDRSIYIANLAITEVTATADVVEI